MDAYEDVDFNNPNSPSIQERILAIKATYCQRGNITLTGWCPEVWDEILCWPSTAPGALAVQACPRYIAGFNNEVSETCFSQATAAAQPPRLLLSAAPLLAEAAEQARNDGQWFWNNETNRAWSNYSQCYTDSLVTLLMELPDAQEHNVTVIMRFVPIVKMISNIGYTVSFFTLLVAFCILAAIKKLRCSRNMLHMHLFLSFMMRAFMALLKDVLFVSGIALPSDVLMKNGKNYWLYNEMETSWLCKAITSFWQYFILANYFWILMEGLYLHNLVFLALFRDANSSIAAYVGLGWGLPAVVVICWVLARKTLDDKYCWTVHGNSYLFLIIRVPTILTILINFVLFINIVRVLLSKLKSTVSEETQRYKRWAKSTLVLVPLFGVHYTIFLGMSYSIGINETVEVVWLFCDQLFASFQGCFVAVLYCFLNGEVRAELSKLVNSANWSRFRLRLGFPVGSRASSNASNTKQKRRTQSSRVSSRSRWRELCDCFSEKRGDSRRSTHSMASTQDIAIRGVSLAGSRGYLEVAGSGKYGLNAHQARAHQDYNTEDRQLKSNTSCPLSSKYTDQSLLSFCSNVSEVSRYSGRGSMQIPRGQEMIQQRWRDTECSQSAFELEYLQETNQS